MTSDLELLNREQAAAIASLVGMGAQSGVTVMGLSGVRRTRQLQLIFLDVSISANTQQELGRRAQDGVRVFRVDGIEAMTAWMGREDVHVLAVKAGPLADGILGKLPGPRD